MDQRKVLGRRFRRTANRSQCAAQPADQHPIPVQARKIDQRGKLGTAHEFGFGPASAVHAEKELCASRFKSFFPARDESIFPRTKLWDFAQHF